jgi:hypothetical protein
MPPTVLAHRIGSAITAVLFRAPALKDTAGRRLAAVDVMVSEY